MNYKQDIYTGKWHQWNYLFRYTNQFVIIVTFKIISKSCTYRACRHTDSFTSWINSYDEHNHQNKQIYVDLIRISVNNYDFDSRKSNNSLQVFKPSWIEFNLCISPQILLQFTVGHKIYVPSNSALGIIYFHPETWMLT